MKFSTISNIGKLRDENEDSYANYSIKDKEFFIVADGMGGHKNGDLASKLAVKSFIDYIKENLDDNDKDLKTFQKQAIIYANDKIYDLSNENDDFKMGTTVVCLTIDYSKRKYYIAHLGDSRLYLYRNEQLLKQTRDHSLVNDLIDTGSLTEDEAKNFINKSAITKAVGTEKNVEPECKVFDMKDDDIILMFTDGLTNELEDSQIKEIVANNKTAIDISSKLVEMALQMGGHDNITVTTILV